MEATDERWMATTLAKLAATNEVPRAWLEIAPIVLISLPTMMWMSLPTAAGLANHVAATKLWIEAVCARLDVHLKKSMADFGLFADNLHHHQPSTPASLESIDNDDNDHKDEDFNIVLSINDADNKIKDITVVLAPRLPLLYESLVVPLLGGGGVHWQCPTVLQQKTACRLKRPCCQPGHRNTNKAIPSLPPRPMAYVGVVYLQWGGALSRRC